MEDTNKDIAEEIHIMVSENETTEGVKDDAKSLSAFFKKAKVHNFEEYGHFTLGEMGTDKFPELLELILK